MTIVLQRLVAALVVLVLFVVSFVLWLNVLAAVVHAIVPLYGVFINMHLLAHFANVVSATFIVISTLH